MPPSSALLGGFAIGARVALLWQHNANPSYKLASIPRYDDIVRTLGGVCECCWPVTGGVFKIAWHIWEMGVAGWPVTGRRWGRSQHYCGGLDCGIPLVTLWQHNANANVSEYMLILAVCLVYISDRCSCIVSCLRKGDNTVHGRW